VVNSIGSSTRRPLMFSGLASGMDTAGMIEQLLAAKRVPITEMQGRVTDRQRQADAIKDVSGRLNNLLTQAKKFVDAGFTQAKSASVAAGTSGSPAGVTVSADSTATVGSFKVLVNRLADATRVAGPSALGTAIDPAALLKDANLGIGVTKGSFTVNGVSIAVDPETDTLNTVMQRIRDNVPGVSVSLANDSSGRPNVLQLSHAAGVTLGSGADSSNFLKATKLLSSPAGTTRASTGNLGVVKTGATLATAGLVTPLSQSAGSFKVNGVEIAYDSSRDSLSAVLSRINNSTAGVTASYDAANDTVSLVSKTTGSVAIALEDVAGNFLDAIGVRTAPQTLGRNAEFQVDTGSGWVTHYSTTNTATGAVPGVTLTLQRETAAADSVTVGQDTNTIVGRMKEFVTQVNSTLDFINTQTKFNKELSNGPLAGDSGIQGIASSLRRLITGRIDGVGGGKTSLGDIGISYGAVGSKAGTTNTLTLDEAKFKAALETDPAGVANVLSAFRATAALNAGGTGGVQSLTGDPSTLRRPGTYTLTTEVNGDGTAKVTAMFKPADGGASITSSIDNVAAGSSDTGLIPGVTLTFKGAFTAGTDTIAVATPTRGIAAKLEQFLEPLTRGGGALDQRQDTAQSDIKSMKDRIDRMNTRLDRERELLQSKFARMEVALTRAQEQRSSLNALAQALAVVY
jgi:flagellar hook-associated protein 2